MTPVASPRSPTLARSRARAAHAVLSVAQAGADLVPAPVRYGTVRTATKLLLRRAGVTSVPAPAGVAVASRTEVVLLADRLDSGGVEAIVSVLARRLPEHGISTAVVCAHGGGVAEFLRGTGVTVIEAPSRVQAGRALAALSPQVIELHSPPADLVAAALDHGAALVPVVHNTELFRSDADWELQSALAAKAGATIAVSQFVGEQHVSRLRRHPPGPLVVVPNGVAVGSGEQTSARDEARRHVAAVLGIELGHDPLAVCLGRWDPQKNLPGLVAGFTEALHRRASLRLVIAGGIQDWLEFRKADALRRSSAAADRIHMLSLSHTATLLAAADLFVLDSFFEGWPVAATEAAVSGLPLLLADVGGAAELAGPHGARGLVVPNPAADGLDIDAGSIRRARRAPRQRNRGDLVEAIVSLHDDIDSWRDRRPQMAVDAAQRFDERVMLAQHARVLREASAGGRR